MRAPLDTLVSGRSGAGYDAHSYHTKVPPAAIARLIADKLPGGGVVGDAFCGSGTTGQGAALAEAVTGATYDVVLGDLSPFATFLAEVQNAPPDAAAFEQAARQALARAADAVRGLWSTAHADGRPASILYVVWSEVLVCPGCAAEHLFWDLGVDHEHGGIRRLLTCPECRAEFQKAQSRRATEQIRDGFAARSVRRPRRVPVQIAYEIDGRKHLKAPDEADLAVIAGADELTAPDCCPRRLMLDREPPWGDLHRAGYHEGITHVHHFYTWRSFVTVGHLWQAAMATREPRAVRFLVSSYNLSHSTLMSRVVFKRGQRRPVLTGYQTGALYISSLPVEKNPLLGLERSKLPAVARGFAVTRGRRGSVRVSAGPAQAWRELDTDVDYFFLDPPFGGNIPYAEANFIAEAWLGDTTAREDEAIISRAQGKSAEDYRSLLAESFDALAARLSPRGSMTVMFHSSSPEPWNALSGALADAGLERRGILRLDKKQGSFKQVRTGGAVEGDLLIDVTRRRAGQVTPRRAALEAPGAWLSRTLPDEVAEVDLAAMRRLFSDYVAECLATRGTVDMGAAQFYAAVREHVEARRAALGQAA